MDLLTHVLLLSPVERGEVDEAVATWLVTAAAETEEDDPDAFLELASSLVPTFADRRADAGLMVRTRFAEWRRARAAAESTAEEERRRPSSLSPQPAPLLPLNEEQQLTAVVDADVGAEEVNAHGEEDPRLLALTQLCGAENDDEETMAFLGFVLYSLCHGDADEAAATHLLDAQSRAEAWATWRSHATDAARRSKENEEKERRARERVLARFDERADGTVAVQHRVSKKNLAAVAAQTDSRVRFRDGRVVDTKGAKYIVENLTEEWDGGSRGRVKTKGKRGAGWAAG